MSPPIRLVGGNAPEQTVEARQLGGVVVPLFQSTVESEPNIVSTVNAQLPRLPSPLRLIHGPLLATVETWSHGIVVARLPLAALYAEGDNDSVALAELGQEILEFAQAVSAKIADGEQIAGPLEYQWRALTSVVDVSGLSTR